MKLLKSILVGSISAQTVAPSGPTTADIKRLIYPNLTFRINICIIHILFQERMSRWNTKRFVRWSHFQQVHFRY